MFYLEIRNSYKNEVLSGWHRPIFQLRSVLVIKLPGVRDFVCQRWNSC